MKLVPEKRFEVASALCYHYLMAVDNPSAVVKCFSGLTVPACNLCNNLSGKGFSGLHLILFNEFSTDA